MFLFICILFKNVITHSKCVFCVWVDCHFVLGEPAYDEFQARDGET